MNLPSVSTLMELTHDRESAKRLRSLLEEKYPPRQVLIVADTYLPFGNGVEVIDAGHNEKSPKILYCNAGDPYIPTLMYVCGRGFKVGCWGDIVERGDYD